MPRPPLDADTLGARLRLARDKRKLTQPQLEQLSGVAQSDISKLERGRSTTTSGIARLAAALDVSPLWLELGKEPIPTWGEPAKPTDYTKDSSPPSDSEWALLQDVRRLPHDEREQLMADMRARARKYEDYLSEQLGNFRKRS